MKYNLPREVMIMFAAQQLVDSWLRARKRRPFAEAARAESHRIWNEHPEYRNVRRAFVAAARRARAGYGHAEANPAPLLDVINQELAHEPSTLSPGADR
ncbi:MAG: hypothetical protein M3Y37_08610 [Chloroflexota bacterium]|jgi:hypothetical protein|nr:hypothetical protein [Chloroflexota bacterium]